MFKWPTGFSKPSPNDFTEFSIALSLQSPSVSLCLFHPPKPFSLIFGAKPKLSSAHIRSLKPHNLKKSFHHIFPLGLPEFFDMDSLQATYRDDEDEEDLSAPATAAGCGTDAESQDVPPITTSTPSDTPTEANIDAKLEPDPSDELTEDEAASDGSGDPKKSPKSGRELENEEEDEDPPPKKQKQLSSLTTKTAKEESPTLPDAVDGNNGLSIAAAATPGSGTGTNSKKSKKKNNNVWVTKSTRKGKKKSKTNNNNNPVEDTVLITPVPRFPDKTDDTPDMKICLSKVYKAEKVELSEDRTSAGSTKGYRMVRATRGVVEGAWYFEIKVVKLGETGHTRLGWSTEKGDLQAPVGYDANSFGYRDIDGSKIHKALREKYGEEGYKEGDVIGFYINLPDGAMYAPKSPHLVWYKGQRYVCGPDAKEDPPKVVPGEWLFTFFMGILFCIYIDYAIVHN